VRDAPRLLYLARSILFRFFTLIPGFAALGRGGFKDTMPNPRFKIESAAALISQRKGDQKAAIGIDVPVIPRNPVIQLAQLRTAGFPRSRE
jgi:hypothetical protein